LAHQLLAYLHVICLSALNFSHVAICQSGEQSFRARRATFLGEQEQQNLNAHRRGKCEEETRKSTGFSIFPFPHPLGSASFAMLKRRKLTCHDARFRVMKSALFTCEQIEPNSLGSRLFAVKTKTSSSSAKQREAQAAEDETPSDAEASHLVLGSQSKVSS
jgi:hypothetical protein